MPITSCHCPVVSANPPPPHHHHHHRHPRYRLKGKTPEFEAEVWTSLVENLCDVGKIGDMYQASSPNDITFWVLHPTLDRLWHWIRLSATHDNFDDT